MNGSATDSAAGDVNDVNDVNDVSGGGARPWLVGGLGWPHDELSAAGLRAQGHDATALGALDVDALERGRGALPRGQCAPMLYTTGALLRAVEAGGRPVDVLSVQSCGPCRYALFGKGWQGALRGRGLPEVRLRELGQSPDALAQELGHRGAAAALEILVVADVLVECANRLRPYELAAGSIDEAARAAGRAIANRIADGERPIEAARSQRAWHEGLWRVTERPLGRAVLIGEPWSLHVEGDGQLRLPSVLARAGVEVEVPPLALWLSYLLWQARTAPWGGGPGPDAARLASVRAAEAALATTMESACDAAGLAGFELPSMDELAELARPLLSPALRGGYGHLEVALAVRARRERRAHVVFSLKSFGCIPSSGVSDAIVPTALEGLPFLALEVCADGEAARESRLMMRVASALDEAERELDVACRGASLEREARAQLCFDPLAARFEVGERPYACSLACEAQR